MKKVPLVPMRLFLIFIIVFLMVMQAHGQERHGGWHGGGHNWGHGGYGRHDDNSGLVGGVLGGLLGSWLFPPPVVVVPQEVPEIVPGSPAWYAYCQNKYKSFNPQTGTYLGFDGVTHPCQ